MTNGIGTNTVGIDVEVAIIGAGLAGANAAWQLATRGIDVALIDAYRPGHRHGSSHGSSRIFRRAYLDPLYIDLTGETEREWRHLESESGESLLTITGGVDHGSRRDPRRLAALLENHGVDCELLTAHQAADRWPSMRFTGPVVFHPQAGVVNPDATIAAAVRLAQSAGAHCLFDHRVSRVEIESGHVTVRGSSPVTARTVVVAAGAWLPELAAQLGIKIGLPRLTVTQQQVFHFRQFEPDPHHPVFVHKDNLQMYGLPSGSDAPMPAIKIGRFDDPVITTASTRTGEITAEQRKSVTDYAREWFPGVDPEPVAEASCLFTRTDNEDFILDRVGPVVIASPCSGHGAKFAPLLGRMIADLATGRPAPERFRLPPTAP